MSDPYAPLIHGTIVHPSASGFVVRRDDDRSVLSLHADAADAIEAGLQAAAGATTQLEAGTYPLQRSVIINGKVRLCGRGDSTRLQAAGCSTLISIGQASVGAEIRALALHGDGHATGLHGQGCGGLSCLDLAIHGCSIGLKLSDAAQLCRIAGCLFTANSDAHCRLEELAEGSRGNYLPNDIHGCRFLGGGIAVDCWHAIVVNIVACSVHQAHGAAFRIRKQSNSVLISGCRTFQITGDAVQLDDAHEFCCTGNVFCWQTGHGITARACRWGTITGNEVIDNGSANPGGVNFTRTQTEFPGLPLMDGIRLDDCRGYTVTGNAVFNWNVAPHMAVGIRADERCGDNAVVANAINRHRAALRLADGTHAAANVDQPACLVGEWDRLQTFEEHQTAAFCADLAR